VVPSASCAPLRALALTAALLCVLLATAAASAADAGAAGRGAGASRSGAVVLERGDRGSAVTRVQRRLRLSPDGVFGRMTQRAVKRFQRRRGLVVDGVVGPATRSALRLRPFSHASVYRRGRSRRRGRSVRLPALLRRIAMCESGGNPRAVSAGGDYRGKYQFMRSTWRGLGGKGDPARAPEWLQDRLALKLYRRSRTAPWPSCSSSA